MATPIQNNTEALHRILQAVNDLPEAGSGSGSGATVQTKRGSFTTTSNGKSVVCGFKPDFVAITANEVITDGSTYFQTVAFLFSEYTGYDYINSLMYSPDNSGDYSQIVDIWARQTDNGFFVAYYVNDIGTWENAQREVMLEYVAFKFT